MSHVSKHGSHGAKDIGNLNCKRRTHIIQLVIISLPKHEVQGELL